MCGLSDLVTHILPFLETIISSSTYHTLENFNPYPARLFYLIFYPLEVVHRHRDPQLQVAENYSFLLNLSTSVCKSWFLDTLFIPNNSVLVD